MESDPIKFTKDKTVPNLSHYAPQQPAVEQLSAPVNRLNKEYSGPKERIALPSEGLLYPKTSPLSSGFIDIKYMTAKEEDILMSQQLIRNGTMLDVLLKELIVTPGANFDDLLLGDKTAVFLHARRLAYGDEYVHLQACPSCGTKTKVTLEISTLKTKELRKDIISIEKNIFEFTLPVSKKILSFKLLTAGDERKIDQELKALEKAFGGKTGRTSPELTTRLKYMITAIDGKEQRATINSFVDNDMLAKDSIAFRSYIKEISPDYIFTHRFQCQHCDYDEELPYDLGVDFILPEASSSV